MLDDLGRVRSTTVFFKLAGTTTTTTITTAMRTLPTTTSTLTALLSFQERVTINLPLSDGLGNVAIALKGIGLPVALHAHCGCECM